MQTAPSETRIIFNHIFLESRPWARDIVNIHTHTHTHTHTPDPLLLWIDCSKAPVGVGNVDGKQNDVCFFQVLYTYRHAHTHTHKHTRKHTRTPRTHTSTAHATTRKLSRECSNLPGRHRRCTRPQPCACILEPARARPRAPCYQHKL